MCGLGDGGIGLVTYHFLCNSDLTTEILSLNVTGSNPLLSQRMAHFLFLSG